MIVHCFLVVRWTNLRGAPRSALLAERLAWRTKVSRGNASISAAVASGSLSFSERRVSMDHPKFPNSSKFIDLRQGNTKGREQAMKLR